MQKGPNFFDKARVVVIDRYDNARQAGIIPTIHYYNEKHNDGTSCMKYPTRNH